MFERLLIRLKVERLSKERDAAPVWSWSSKIGTTPDDVDRFWQAFLRRFDLEHTFRFAKQTLGWTTPKRRAPEAADRWTWILIVARTQLRLARPLAADLRRPWERQARKILVNKEQAKGCPVPPPPVDQRAASDAVHRKAEGRPHTGCIRVFRQRGEVP